MCLPMTTSWPEVIKHFLCKENKGQKKGDIVCWTLDPPSLVVLRTEFFPGFETDASTKLIFNTFCFHAE